MTDFRYLFSTAERSRPMQIGGAVERRPVKATVPLVEPILPRPHRQRAIH